MRILTSLLVVVVVSFFAVNVFAQVLFEGYYKVSQFDKHVGFVILKHEIDTKTKNFKSTSLVRLAKQKLDMTETYQAISKSDFAPVSLSYVGTGQKQMARTIDVTFKDGKMSGLVVENGKKIKINEKTEKGIFLSSALYYLMLNSKDGLKTGTTFDFKAVTEEGPVVTTGTVTVDKNMQSQGALQLFKVNTRFASSESDNLISSKGEIVSTTIPATQMKVELVKNPAEATEGIKISSGNLEKIFGSIPEGKTNLYFQK